MTIKNNIKKYYDLYLISLFVFFCFLNQIKFLNLKLDIFFKVYVVFFFFSLIYFLYLKKFNFEKLKFFFLIILSCLIVLADFLYNRYLFDLKIFFNLSLIIYLGFLIFQFEEKIFLKILIYISLIFLIIGTAGWLNGGESPAWGKQYVYFSYKYLPSTKNEDAQIFLYGFIASLYFIFFYKWDLKFLLINQFNLVAIVLTFSRGVYVVTVINLMILTFEIITIRSLRRKLKTLLGYIFFSIFVVFFSINLINKTLVIELDKVFIVKLKSFNFLSNEKKDIPSEKDYNHLLTSSRESLKIKVNQWNKIFNQKKIQKEIENTESDNFFKIIANKIQYYFFSKDKKYYENSFLYFILNFNLFTLIFLLIFFIKLIINRLQLFNLNKNILFITFLVTSTLLNFIYNYLDDIWNYFILLYLITAFNKNFKTYFR